MIVMNLELDNLLGFDDFTINFSYPKKIVHSSIPNEFLLTKPNFRYKKVNILMGANASGKTSIGKALMTIFNFMRNGIPSKLKDLIREKEKTARFSIDFLLNESTLYRLDCTITPNLKSGKKNEMFPLKNEEIDMKLYSSKILKKDSYESCLKKLDEILPDESDYYKKLQEIPPFGWLFTFPDDDAKRTLLDDDDFSNLNIFELLMQTLDPSIKKVEKSEEVDNTYIIRGENGDVLIQNGEVIDKNILSSGTRMGIDIAYILDSLCKNEHGFYYCDEKFSFIQSDVERSVLSLMIDMMKPNSQLFFTSHNLDLLNLGLPIHSFVFLRKNTKIEVVYPEATIRKNDISLRNAVENDVFNISPDLSKLFELEGLCTYETK